MSLNVTMLRQSFEAIKPIATQFVDKFYVNLWTDYPESRDLFANVDMVKQKAALFNSLATVVTHLEDSERLVSYLKGLGARHNAYGTEIPHYTAVGASLLKTFKGFLGSDWTPALEAEWTAAYGLIASVMQEGAKEAKDGNRGKAVRSAPKAVEDGDGSRDLITSVQLPAEFKHLIHGKVREHVRQLIKNEIAVAIAEELRHFSGANLEGYLKKVI